MKSRKLSLSALLGIGRSFVPAPAVGYSGDYTKLPDGSRKYTSACAMMAVLLGHYGSDIYPATTADASDVTGLSHRAPPCPECKTQYWAMSTLLTHLNDKHKWDTERIGSYLETLGL